MKKLLVIVMALFALSVSAQTKTLGLVISTLDNPFFVTLKEGAEKQAEALGYKIIVLDSQNDSAKELANVEDLVTKKVSVLMVNPVDSSAVASAIKIANKAKVPVVTLDRSAAAGTVVSHIASDNTAGGKMAAELLIQKLPKGAKVVELEGIPGASAARERGKGFDDTIKGKLELITKQPADFDRTKGLNVMENILQAHSKIDAVFAQNDEMALGALKAIEASGRKGILVVGFDATDDAVAAVKAGKMLATVAQKPSKIGSIGVDTADKIVKGVTTDKFVPVELELVLK